MKDPKNVKQGKANRRLGADTERRTRKDLEKDGWIVSRWQNNVEFNIEHQGNAVQIIPDEVVVGKCIAAKQGRFRMTSTGFPDFFAYKKIACWNCRAHKFGECSYEIVFIECKTNGKMSKEEKEKAKWYLDNGYCDRFYIAYRIKIKNRIKIEYKEFK